MATSTTGIIGQVRVLYELGEGEYGADDDYHDPGGCARLRDTIIAGIERLARGAVI